jgi:ketosteroid isomerase-like protein
MAMPVTLTPDLVALSDRMIAAIEAGDATGVRACFTDDAVIWHNYDQLDVGVSDVLPLLASLVELVPGVRYDEIRRHPIDGGFMQQHVVRGAAAGGELAMPACMVITVCGGKIARLEEYLDLGALRVLVAKT